MATDKLDTVRKLLAKAERAATAAEAESYTAKAVELMARHGIDQALLAARLGPSARDRDEIAASHIAVADPYSAGKARLLAWTASALRCRAVLHEAVGGRVAAVTVLGFASDRARVELLYTSLLLQASSRLAVLRPGRPGVRRGVSAGRAGSAGAVVRFGLRGGRLGRGTGRPWPSRDAAHQAAYRAAGPRWLGACPPGRSDAGSAGWSAARWDCGARSGGDIPRTAASTRRARSARSGASA